MVALLHLYKADRHTVVVHPLEHMFPLVYICAHCKDLLIYQNNHVRHNSLGTVGTIGNIRINYTQQKNTVIFLSL